MIDHLWQSTLFALAAAGATLAFRSNGAHVRYWLWFTASVKFLVPFSLLVNLGRAYAPRDIAFAPPEPMAFAIQAFSTPAGTFAGASTANIIDARMVIALLWAIGSMAVLAGWARKWLSIRAALRSATPLALDAPVPVMATAARGEPGLVGIFRPVLLMPADLAASFSEEELGTVLRHEICHLRRRDNLTAAIHMIVQILFWFHPLVWWIGTRLVAERENACDEAVLAAGDNPDIYAETILKVCRLYFGSPLICAAGVSGGSLRQRIERIIVNRQVRKVSAMKSISIATAAIAALSVPVLAGWHGRVMAQGAEPGSPVTYSAPRNAQSAPGASVTYSASRNMQAAESDPAMAFFVDVPRMMLEVGTPTEAGIQFGAALQINCAQPPCTAQMAAVDRALPAIMEDFKATLRTMRLADVKGTRNMLRLQDALRDRANAETGSADLVKSAQFHGFFILSRGHSQVYFDDSRAMAVYSSQAPKPAGLSLTQSPVVVQRAGGMEVLAVKGNIANTGSAPRGYPALNMRLVNARNEVVRTVIGLPPYGGDLPPGTGMDFELAVRVPQEDGLKLVAFWGM